MALRQRRGQDARLGAGLAAAEMPQEEIAQHRHVVTGAVLEAVPDDDRLHVVVADGADDRVLERADLHDLVHERIVGATQALHLVPGAFPLRVFGGRDDERFEVRLLPVAGLHVRRQKIFRARRFVRHRIPRRRVVAKRAGQERARHVLHQPDADAGIPLRERLFDRAHEARPWIGEKRFERSDRTQQAHRFRKQRLFGFAARGRSLPGAGDRAQLAPRIHARFGGRKEVGEIDRGRGLR